VVLTNGSRLDLPRGRYLSDGNGRFHLPSPGLERPVPVGLRPAPRVKSATGYPSGAGLDLVDLFVGSEGTLGVVTEVEVELIPAPEGTLTAVAFFPREEAAWSFIRAARDRSYRSRDRWGPAAVTPAQATEDRPRAAPGRRFEATALEYYGRDTLEFLRGGGRHFPAAAVAAVHFEQETTEETEAELAGDWLSLIEEHGGAADDTWVAAGPADRERLRELRHAVPEAMNEFLARHGQHKFSTDVAVPDEHLETLFTLYRQGADRSGLVTATFGHAGQNHLHLNLLPRNTEEAERARTLWDELVRAALRLGGVLSAEHGIGKLKAETFAAVTPPEEIARLLAIRRALDPGLVLGRGTLLPARFLEDPAAHPATE
jgi:D-lactate dehydrogenase (cytochrome)